MIRRALLLLSLVSVAVAGLTVTGATPASAGLTTTRNCKDFYTGDQVRRLSVCALMWFGTSQARAVVQEHSYIRVNSQWIDVTSQSITINSGSMRAIYNPSGGVLQELFFGNDPIPLADPTGGTSCRINSPSGPVGCSVPNTGRVEFYSKAGALFGGDVQYQVVVDKVSWRDDRGQPHVVNDGDNSFPDKLPLKYP
jgi:hypothetical protein